MNYPLLDFETDSFSFRTYSNTEQEQTMIQEFNNDEATQLFLPDFLKYIKETEEDLATGIDPMRFTSIVYYKNNPVGLITFYDVCNELIFSHGIRPSERGKRLSSKIKTEVFNYVFNNLERVEKITVYIDTNNSNNLHSLQKLQYDEIKLLNNDKENKSFYKISTKNPHLKKQK